MENWENKRSLWINAECTSTELRRSHARFCLAHVLSGDQSWDDRAHARCSFDNSSSSLSLTCRWPAALSALMIDSRLAQLKFEEPTAAAASRRRLPAALSELTIVHNCLCCQNMRKKHQKSRKMHTVSFEVFR